MSYQEKRTIVSILSGVLIIIAYSIYVFTKLQSGLLAPYDIKSWAITILAFIGIGIVVTIITQIIYHIALAISVAVIDKEHDEKKINSSIEASTVEDEMDKLIELKSLRFGFVFAGLGFLCGLISLVLDQPSFIMLNILLYSFSIGSIIEGLVSLYYYRNGI